MFEEKGGKEWGTKRERERKRGSLSGLQLPWTGHGYGTRAEGTVNCSLPLGTDSGLE